MTFVRPRLDLGTGADGAITVASNNDWKTLWAKQELNAASLTLNAGVTLTLATDYRPHILRATGTVTLKGTGVLQGTGKGFSGGSAAIVSDKRGNSGYGYVPGRAGETGADGGHAATAPFTNFFDWLLGAALVAAAGVGGGSGGGQNGGGSDPYGGKGGDGGAGLYVVCDEFIVETGASLVLNGAVGESLTKKGGDASGGILAVAANKITVPASGDPIITAVSNGSGADGKIILAYKYSITADAANRCDPVATIVNLGLVPLTLG